MLEFTKIEIQDLFRASEYLRKKYREMHWKSAFQKRWAILLKPSGFRRSATGVSIATSVFMMANLKTDRDRLCLISQFSDYLVYWLDYLIAHGRNY